MAEYKYRALGWKDDDIASLNVVDGTAADGTAADNRVVLQITKQGAGTIDGPAIVGKDGITIDKPADSEKIEISGSGCVQKITGKSGAYGNKNSSAGDAQIIYPVDNSNVASYQAIPLRDTAGSLYIPDDSIGRTDYNFQTGQEAINKKYVDDNFVKKDTSVKRQQVYGHDENGNPQMFYLTTGNANPNWLCMYQAATFGADKPSGTGRLITQDPTQPYQAANKHYVDEADKDLRLKFSNLEQALNGYILDTTKEAYADLDSAVLKNSVAVGGNVYPIADKTRALVSRIEGKTTKMVQLLDKSNFPATSTPTAGVTVTKTDDGGLHVLGTAASSGGMSSWGITVNVEKGHKYLSLLKGNNKITTPSVSLKSDTSQYVSFVADIVTSTIEGECYYGFNLATGDYDETIYPQLFDLTAMNREDITTIEQFKAEFPDLYPYENGNIYPAKISGVKFYEKQDKSGEQASVTLPETYDLHGVGDYKDYLEITKNEDNELYTLKKVQNVGVYEYTGNEAWTVGADNFTSVFRYYCIDIVIPKTLGDKGICNKYATLTDSKDEEGVLFGLSNAFIYLFLNKTNFPDINSVKSYLSAQYAENNPVVIYYRLSSPVETVIATNLTYEQVTAIRHNGGLIEVEGNINKAYAKPTVTNTIVYRLTATNTTEV